MLEVCFLTYEGCIAWLAIQHIHLDRCRLLHDGSLCRRPKEHKEFQEHRGSNIFGFDMLHNQGNHHLCRNQPQWAAQEEENLRVQQFIDKLFCCIVKQTYPFDILYQDFQSSHQSKCRRLYDSWPHSEH